MKSHTSGFKNALKSLGRELSAKVTYTSGNETIELGNTELNSISIHYEGGLLKSVMKQLDLDSNVDIPLGTQINAQFGLKVGNGYEYLNYGNFIVYSSEKQEDLSSYKIIAYDKMLYSMKDYETLVVEEGGELVPLEYPVTIREYISVLCNNLGLSFANKNDVFANYNKQLQNELYLDSDGNSLGYTFRDVIDEIAQATASTICINDNDELELRYVTLTGDTTSVEGTSLYITNAVRQRIGDVGYGGEEGTLERQLNDLNNGYLYEGVNNISQINNDLPFNIELEYITQSNFETINEEYLKDINVNFGEKYGPINSIVLSRSADSDKVYLKDDASVEENGLCEIEIADNQIMNGNDRSNYLPDIFNVLDGIEYYINDYSSTGICYLELCDRYGVSIDGKVYDCIMFNDEINIDQGIEESIHTDMPDESETDYSKADKTDRRIKQAYIIVDKQNQRIDSVVSDLNVSIDGLNSLVNSQGEQITALGTRVTQNMDSVTTSITSIQETLDNGVGLVKTTSVTIDDSGLNVSTDTSKISTTMTNNSFEIKDNTDTKLAYFGYDETEQTSKAEMDNLTISKYLTAGVHRQEKIEGEDRTGWFYIGGV